MRTIAVIPALDEAGNIGPLVSELTREVDAVVVVDNGSTDTTADEADAAGADVVAEPVRGYGRACAAGSARAVELGADVIVYIDGDRSSPPDEAGLLLGPIRAGRADLVQGSRTLGRIESGAMPAHQRLGNRFSSWLIRRLHRAPITDLGPFRAITAEALQSLSMREMTFGWPTEMTVKAARNGLRVEEVPVTWRARTAGASKVSGTVRGSVLAARFIIGVTLRYAWRR